MLGAVSCSGFAFGDVGQFAFDELTAYGRDTVGEHIALQMVVFMLDDTSTESRVLLFVLIEVFVEITNDNSLGARHILTYTRQRKTAFALDGSVF